MFLNWRQENGTPVRRATAIRLVSAVRGPGGPYAMRRNMWGNLTAGGRG